MLGGAARHVGHDEVEAADRGRHDATHLWRPHDRVLPVPGEHRHPVLGGQHLGQGPGREGSVGAPEPLPPHALGVLGTEQEVESTAEGIEVGQEGSVTPVRGAAGEAPGERRRAAAADGAQDAHDGALPSAVERRGQRRQRGALLAHGHDGDGADRDRRGPGLLLVVPLVHDEHVVTPREARPDHAGGGVRADDHQAGLAPRPPGLADVGREHGLGTQGGTPSLRVLPDLRCGGHDEGDGVRRSRIHGSSLRPAHEPGKTGARRLWTTHPGRAACGPTRDGGSPYPRDMPASAGVRTAAFFDLDKTIIARSSTLAFSKAFYAGGLLNRRAVVRSAYANLVFGVRGADHDRLEQMRLHLTELIEGWDVEAVRGAVRDTLHEIVDPIVYAEAVDLIEEHRAAGHDVIIVSASGSEVVEPIGEMLGVDDVIATTLVERDGRYTGEVEFYAYGPHKATAMERIAQERGLDLDASYAYSDSETDVPMLETVGHPFAVNPDRTLRQVATERGWPILNFERPVGLRRRLGLGARTGLVAAALGAVVGGVVVAVAMRRRLAGAR